MDEAIKRRNAEFKKRLMEEYKARGYVIKKSDNEIVCFTAVDKAKTHECEVRACLDEITDHDIEVMFSLPALPYQRKVIECALFGISRRITRVYDHLNKRCQ